MKTTDFDFFAVRGVCRVAVGVLLICVLVASGLFWGESGVWGKIKVDPRSPINSQSLEGLEMRRLDISPRFARFNARYCGNYSYEAAWLGYVEGRYVCMIYKANGNEFWLLKGDLFIPLSSDIIALVIQVGETEFVYFSCDEEVLRCANPAVMPPISGLDINKKDNLVIQAISAEDNSVEPDGIEPLRERVTSFSNLPWFSKLCYVTETLSYSDNCENEFASPINFKINIADLNTRNSFTLTWHGNTIERDNLTSLPSTMYIRDISTSSPEKIECALDDTRRKAAIEGHQSYTCTGHTLEIEGNFMVLGSTSMATAAGGVVIKLPLPEVRVVAMEVTQGVQNWKNDLTLVKNRRTAVRVFMETDVRKRKVTASLRGTVLSSQGSRTIGETHPVNHNLRVEVAPLVVKYRERIEASLNFLLPTSWSSLGKNAQLNLKVVFEENSINCEDSCSKIVSFTELTKEPYLVMVPLAVKDENEETKISNAALKEQFDRIMSIMPLSNYFYFTLETVSRYGNDPYYGVYFGEYEPVGRDVNIEYYRDILTKWSYDSPDWYLYLGVLPGGKNCGTDDKCLEFPTGDSKISGRAAVWYSGYRTQLRASLSMGGEARNRGGHELGHLLGMKHPIRMRSKNNRISNNLYSGECGEESSSQDIYPHFYQLASGWRPTLGQLYNSEIQVWGLDMRFVAPVKGRRAQGYDSYGNFYSDTDYAVINPLEVFSIMSYCDHETGRPQNQGRWMDAYHHEEIIKSLSGSDSIYSTVEAAINADLISGSVLFSSTGETIDIDFDPIFSRYMDTKETENGDFLFEMRNDRGDTIGSIPFSVQQYSNENEEQRVNFSFRIFDPPEYDSFAVLKEGVEIVVVKRSSNFPTLSVSGVSTGQHFNNDDIINIFWSGQDVDGDSLIYRIYYSTDAGLNYRPLIFDIKDSRASFPASILSGSSQARFGVSVSDGTRSTFVETPIFSIAGVAPHLEITSPISNSIYANDQAVVLDAKGFDKEDAQLTSSSFTWSSSLDGVLGSSDLLVLRASDMSVGQHIITATVKDSDQMTTSLSREIIITAQNQPPITVRDTISTGIDEVVQIDVISNDTDIEGDINVESLSIETLPEIGTTQIVFSQSGYPIIEYSSKIDGTDTFIYEICDYGDRCETAQVTIDIAIPDCTVYGTNGDDILVGTSGNDIICGLDGNDTIDGRSGDDKIYGGEGEDRIYGRSGSDTIYGGNGNDFILGHNGHDIIYGNLGNDTIYAGGGNDLAKGGDGDDELYGEAGNDNLEGNKGHDKMHGGRGNDIIWGGKGDDTIRGNAGEDIIYPGLGNNTVFGISPEDTIF